MSNGETQNRPRSRMVKQFALVIVAALLGALGNLLVSYLIEFFPGFWSSITLFFKQFWISLIGVILILIIGILLYVLRVWKRVVYGFIEVVFAIAYGLYAINKVETVGYVETISVIASIYLVVRGIDNIAEGLKPTIEELSGLMRPLPPWTNINHV